MSKALITQQVPPQNSNALATVVILLIVIAGLYLGAGILVPLVLAILLAFALSPLVRILSRFGIPQALAVILSVLLAIIVLGTFAFVTGTQLIKLASDLPQYQETVGTKISSLQNNADGGAFFDRLTSALESLRSQIMPDTTPAIPRPGDPIPVTISNDIGNPLGIISSILGSVLGPITTAAIVTVFLIFLLLGQDDLRERFIRLVSRGDLSTTTLVIDDAATRVGRYLLVQFTVNLVYGIIFGIGLTFIGVPNAILWGLMATLFRYIPFVGTLIVMLLPATLAFAVDPGWGMLIMTVSLFAVLELVTTNVIEPRLYGSSTGLSPLAVLLAAMFWATLWGPIGLILATPLTVCLVVLGRYVPQLQFLETLLGSEPVLKPEERIYQRLLAGNAEEAIVIMEDRIETTGLSTLYQTTFINTLRMADNDITVHPDNLSQRKKLSDALFGVLEEFEQSDDVGKIENSTVLIIGGKTEIDEAAGFVLSQILAENKITSNVLPPMSVRKESIAQLDLSAVKVVCICYLNPDIKTQARFVIRRLRRLKPELHIILCHLAENAPRDISPEAIAADALLYDLSAAHIDIADTIGKQTTPSNYSTLTSDNDTLIANLQNTNREDSPLAAELSAIAQNLDLPLALVNLVLATTHEADDANTLARVITDARQPLVIHPETDEIYATNTFLLENGIEFYAGVPIIHPNGDVIGALAVLDYEPRDWADTQTMALQVSAAELVKKLSR